MSGNTPDPNYETTTSTTTTVTGGDIKFTMEYVKTIPGMLKIAEIVLCVIIAICCSITYWGRAEGWVWFVSMTALLSTIINLALHLFNFVGRFRIRWLFIFIYSCIFSVLFLVASIVAAVNASLHSSIAAATFFCFVATALFAVDTYFEYKTWQNQEIEVTTTTTYTTVSKSSMTNKDLA